MSKHLQNSHITGPASGDHCDQAVCGSSYASRFQQPDDVAAYELKEYAPGSYASQVWLWQRPVLARILQEFRRDRPGPVRLLDFACGTGRVISHLGPMVDSAEGIDLSPAMIERARINCPSARFQTGDILRQPALLQPGFDIISCFRFFLNVEPGIRAGVLRRLRQVLREPGGLLLVNIHGNSRSLRHPALAWRRWRERKKTPGEALLLNELSPAASRNFLAEAGFRVVRQFGFGMLPPTIYRTPLHSLAGVLDRALSGDNVCRNFSVDMLFVCQPC